MMNSKKYIKIFILSFIIASLLVLPNIIKNKGLFSIPGDYNSQLVAFNIDLSNNIKKGNLFTFNNDLGSSLIESYSYYNMFSVSNIICSILPSKIIPYVYILFVILKLSFTSLFMYMYLSKKIKDENLCLYGSILYTFSSFQICNIYYSFYDTTMLFPLLMIGLENILSGKKNYLYGIILCFILLTNYILGWGVLVFIIIYIIIGFISKHYKYNKSILPNIIIQSLLGLGMASIILYPSIGSIIKNPRINDFIKPINYLTYSFQRYINIIQSFLFGPDPINRVGIVNLNNYSSCEIYIPFIGLVLVLTYILKHKKDFLSIIIYILLGFIFIPILNSSFFFFNNNYYARWFYIPIFFFTVVSIKSLSQKDNIDNGFKLLKLIWYIYILFIVIYIYYIIKSFNTINLYYIINLMIGIVSLIMSYFMIKRYYKTSNILFLLIPTIVVIILLGWHYIDKCSSSNNDYHNLIKDINKEIIDDQDSDFYRLLYYGCIDNTNMLMNKPSITSFTSTLSPSINEIYSSMNRPRGQSTNIDYIETSLVDFYSVKYVVTCNNSKINNKHYKYVKDNGNYSIYLNTNYKKMGIILDNYISTDEFKSSNKKRDLFTNYFIGDNIINNKTKIIDSNTRQIRNGLESNIKVDNDTTILYTIPYDNYIVKVNGEKNNYFKLNNGFIGINLNKGDNNITIEYQGKNETIGLVISTIFVAMYGLYIYLNKK